jgi:hypothetical protein
MNTQEIVLEYLMRYNKKAKEDAENFIEDLALIEPDAIEYWEGQKFHAEMNIRILQSFGISAK